MMYFKYVGKIDSQTSLEIFQKVRQYEPLAKKVYGGNSANWESALDDAYFHILNHYDASKGPLEGYITKIVKTIHLNKYSRETNKEVESDVLLDISSDKYAMSQDNYTNPCDLIVDKEEDITRDSDVMNCVKYLLPYFLKDYEVFYSKGEVHRKFSYKGIFEKFSVNVLYKSVTELLKYYEEAKRISTLAKSCHVRNFAPDRYKSSVDKTIIFICKIGDIVKCKMAGVKRKKYVYSLNLNDLLDKLIDMFYVDDGIAKVIICGIDVFCSLSGQFYYSIDELKNSLETEIIGTILALRTNLKVIDYKKNDEILFSSTNEDEARIILSLFNTGVYMPLVKLTVS